MLKKGLKNESRGIGKDLHGPGSEAMRHVQGPKRMRNIQNGNKPDKRALGIAKALGDRTMIAVIFFATALLVLIVGISVKLTSEAMSLDSEPVRVEVHRIKQTVKPLTEIVRTNEESFERSKIYRYHEEIPLSLYEQILMQKLCEEHKVNYGMALAFLESESTFDENAIGDSGNSIGYMQINKPNWERYDLNAFDKYENIEIGIRMLKELIDKYGELDAVTMAYKGGEAMADEWIAEGYRLPVCDTILERTMYWQEIVNEDNSTD